VALLAGDCRTGAPMDNRLRERAHVHALPFWQVEAECLGAVLALKSGNLAVGIDLMRHHLRRFPGSTLTVRYVAYLGKLADALSRNGEFDEADAAMSEVLARAGAAASHWWMPELMRVEADVALRRDDASASFAANQYRKAMALAHEQGALGWELRIATSVMRHASLLRCESEARQQLSAVYGRFTEGFDTHDAREAADLLGQ
jgi:predicted ATPase